MKTVAVLASVTLGLIASSSMGLAQIGRCFSICPDRNVTLTDVTSDRSGGVYAFAFLQQPPYSTDLLRLTADGSPKAGWMPCGISVATSPIAFAATSDGGALLTWLTGSIDYIQRIGPSGDKAPGPDVLGIAGPEGGDYPTELVTDGADGAYVLSVSYQWYYHDYHYGGFVFHYGGRGRLTLQTPGSPGALSAQLVADGKGGAFVAWQKRPEELFAAHVVDSDEPPPPIYPKVSACPSGFRLVPDATGGAFVAWFETCDMTLYAARILGDGSIPAGWGPSKRIPGPTSDFAIAPDGSGGLLLAWVDNAATRALRLTADGTVASGWPSEGRLLSNVSAGYPHMVGDNRGGAYVAWLATGSIYVQHVLGDGGLSPCFGPGGISLCSAESDPNIVTDGHAGAALIWSESVGARGAHIVDSSAVYMNVAFAPRTLNSRSVGRWVTATLQPEPPASPNEIDVASIRLNGCVPVDVSAPITMGDGDGDGRTDLTVKFERAAVEATVREGSAVPVTIRGEIGNGCFEATDVIRVMRAGPTSPTSSRASGGGLAVEAPLSSPSGNVNVSFTLPDAQPATLRVYDVSGRELIRREIGGLGAGRHGLTLDSATRLAPGLYFVQLIHEDRQRVARVVVIR